MTDLIRAGIAVDSASGVQNISRAEQAFDKLDKTAMRTNAQLGKSTAAFNALKNAVGLVVGIGTVTKFFHDLTGATQESEQAQARLESVLKATGFAAGKTADQIDDLATSMAGTTLFDDEAIKNMAGVLATFRNISGETFTQAIRLGTDMAQVMGQDLQSSALQLGKALNDPIQGVQALRRVGVQLNDHQKDLIQGFIKVNDLAGAQGVILDELAKEFGGAAAAANTGLSGAIAMAKKTYDNFLESLGKTQQVGGAIQGVFQAIANFWKSRELTTKPIEDMRIALDQNQEKLQSFNAAMADVEAGTRSAGSVFGEFIGFEGRAVVSTEEVSRGLLVYGDSLEALVQSQKHQITSLEETERAEEKTAEAAARRTKVKADADRAAAAAADEAEKRRKKEEEHQQAILDAVSALDLEARQLGMTSRQAKLLELSLAGATQEQLKQADAALAAIEQFDAMEEKRKEAEKERERRERELKEKQEKEAKAFEVMWEQALRNTQDVFADFFEQLFTGSVTSTEQLLRELWRMWMRFLAQLAAHALFRFILNLATGGLGFGAGTFGVDFGGGVGIPTDVAHEGGTVGSIAAKRSVSPAAFLGAPRYHGGGVAGLAPDEVPIIAQRGETIIPREGTGARHITLQFPAGRVFDPSDAQQRRDLVTMLQRAFDLREIEVEVR